MAKLIVKSPYIKGSDTGGYLKYIGTREGVELLPSEYMEYMAERPRSHGMCNLLHFRAKLSPSRIDFSDRLFSSFPICCCLRKLQQIQKGRNEHEKK